jgi:hypothetical protein
MRRLLAHMVGDYVCQSDWMAAAKVYGQSKDARKAAAIHAALYTACFLPLTRNPLRLAVIGVTHGLLDHYRPFPKLIHRKDVLLSPAAWPATPAQDIPFWMTVIVDNTAHLLINELALSARRPR